MKKTLYYGFILSLVLISRSIGFGESGEEGEKFIFSGIDNIQIDGNFLDVSFSGSEGDSVEMMVNIPEDLKEKLKVSKEQEGSNLKIWIDVSKKKFSWSSSSDEGELHIFLPDIGRVTAKMSSGDISCKDVQPGKMRFSTASGDIHLNDVDSEMKVDTASGEIKIESCTGNKTIASTSGDISVMKSKGPVSISTRSGDVKLEDIGGNVSATLSSGDITLNGITGALHLKTMSGDQSGRGIKTTGASSFDTTSGDVSIDLADELEKFRFELKSVSGDLKVGDATGEEKLTVGDGEIAITGSAVSGDIEFH